MAIKPNKTPTKKNREEAIRMAYRDYEALEHPRVGHFASAT